MIKSIDFMDDLGIYQSYKKDNNLKDFSIFNLFYGWNGCGKSTLTKIFRSLETKDLPKGFENPKFKLTLDDNTIISSANLTDFLGNIYVYNTDFVKENIDWNNKVKSILILSQQNIGDTEEINKLREELNGNKELGVEGLIEQLRKKQISIEKLDEEIENILTKVAKNIKTNLGVIATNDSYYLNYRKDKLKNLITGNEVKFKNLGISLSQEEIDNLIKQARPEQKGTINHQSDIVNCKDINNLIHKINEIIDKKITAKVIERLKQNLDISEWVQKGIELHKDHKSNNCEFCGQALPKSRINELEDHFNDQMNILRTDIENIKEEVISLKINCDKVKIEAQVFYPEYVNDVKVYNTNIDDLTVEINRIFEEWIILLNKKKQDPFKEIIFDEHEINDLVKKYNFQVAALNNLIMAHNEKTNNFETEVDKAKNKLELYYAQEQLKDYKYFENLNSKDNEQDIYIKMKEEIDIKGYRFHELESKLSNEALGAEQFNKEIAEFIGYDEIALKFNKSKRGYEIVRSSNSKPANNLSEGEKSAIAFVYFITKLKENGNKMENSIIVVDDPVSSFDSDKLFNAFAYLKNHCNNSKQLFVLTHNFNYFKLIRQWFSKNDRKNGQIVDNYKFYEIVTEYVNDVRVGAIKNAGSSLNQSSEYDYIFRKVYEYSKKAELSQDEMNSSANIARKLVEAFLSFKFPRQRSSIKKLLTKAFPEHGENDLKFLRIYNFINTYSHNGKIDIACDLAEDNILAESHNVMKDILELIEIVDKQHYDDMVKIVNE